MEKLFQQGIRFLQYVWFGRGHQWLPSQQCAPSPPINGVSTV